MGYRIEHFGILIWFAFTFCAYFGPMCIGQYPVSQTETTLRISVAGAEHKKLATNMLTDWREKREDSLEISNCKVLPPSYCLNKEKLMLSRIHECPFAVLLLCWKLFRKQKNKKLNSFLSLMLPDLELGKAGQRQLQKHLSPLRLKFSWLNWITFTRHHSCCCWCYCQHCQRLHQMKTLPFHLPSRLPQVISHW